MMQVKKHKMFKNEKVYSVEKLNLAEFASSGNEQVTAILGEEDAARFQESVKTLLKEFTADGGKIVTKTPDVVFNEVITSDDMKEKKNRFWEIVFAVVHVGKLDNKFRELLSEFSYEIVEIPNEDGTIERGCYTLMQSTKAASFGA